MDYTTEINNLKKNSIYYLHRDHIFSDESDYPRKNGKWVKAKVVEWLEERLTGERELEDDLQERKLDDLYKLAELMTPPQELLVNLTLRLNNKLKTTNYIQLGT